MKILIVTREYPPKVGGVGRFAQNLVRGLEECGACGCVLTTTPNPELSPGFELVTAAPGRASRAADLAALLRGFIQLYRRTKPDYSATG